MRIFAFERNAKFFGGGNYVSSQFFFSVEKSFKVSYFNVIHGLKAFLVLLLELMTATCDPGSSLWVETSRIRSLVVCASI